MHERLGVPEVDKVPPCQIANHLGNANVLWYVYAMLTLSAFQLLEILQMQLNSVHVPRELERARHSRPVRMSFAFATETAGSSTSNPADASITTVRAHPHGT
jgi:hypothetical protein